MPESLCAYEPTDLQGWLNNNTVEPMPKISF